MQQIMNGELTHLSIFNTNAATWSNATLAHNGPQYVGLKGELDPMTGSRQASQNFQKYRQMGFAIASL